MKHANAEMIKAVADNTDLVAFCKGKSGKWKVTCHADIFYNDSFLCLPQHKEACLHWLNGGEVECNSNLTSGWESCHNISNITWG